MQATHTSGWAVWTRGSRVAMIYSHHPSPQPSPSRPGAVEIARLVTEPLPDLLALRSLDPEAVSAIHARFFGDLFRYAAYRTGNDQLAEDLASETLVRLLQSVKSGKGPTTSVRGWLMGTLANLVNDHFRRVYGRPTEELSEDLHSNGPDPSALAEQNERQTAMRHALGRLTTEQQHVLSLRFGSELSLEETAQLMDRSVNAIKALQFRALASLRRELEPRRA